MWLSGIKGDTAFANAAVALLLTAILLLSLSHASAQEEWDAAATVLKTEGSWVLIENSEVTVKFPANGSEPMFLWRNTGQESSVNVVKLKGIMEYVTYNQSHFVWRSRAEAKTIKAYVYEQYLEPAIRMRREHPTCYTARGTWHAHQIEVERILGEFESQEGFHSGYLPFDSCKWKLEMDTPRYNAEYLGFNFTLVETPEWLPNLQFAENNIVIRCRFYYTASTTDAADANELKMNLVIKQWKWNIDKLAPFLPALDEHMLGQPANIPVNKAGLALWINLATLKTTTLLDTRHVEANSIMSSLIVEGEKLSVAQNKTVAYEEQPLQGETREKHTFRFEKISSASAGFFKFTPQALIQDSATGSVSSEATSIASYISSGGHARVFLGYPYFGNNTLEHGSSLGLEALPTLIEPAFVAGLFVVATTVTCAVFVAMRSRKRLFSLT